MCETRADILDKKLLELMAKSGCEALYIGVESGSQRLLDFIKKGETLEQFEEIFSWIKEFNIKTYASFIVGLPTETEEELNMTINFAKKINPTTAGFNVFVGIPTSKLYEYILKNRIYIYKDKVGLLYLPNHNRLVKRFYGKEAKKAKIPSWRIILRNI